MVAGKVLHGQIGPLAGHGIEEHGGAERGIRPCLVVNDGEEGGEAVGGDLLLAGDDTPDTVVSGTVDTDSRAIGPGDIFVAKPGETTDGHLFVPAAHQAGAVLALVERPVDEPITQIVVRDVVQARGSDIYGTPGTSREVYSLYARVRPGNSGGPLLSTSGDVVGVIFAKSLDDDTTGYALTLDEARPVLAAAASAERPVSTGPCVAG